MSVLKCCLVLLYRTAWMYIVRGGGSVNELNDIEIGWVHRLLRGAHILVRDGARTPGRRGEERTAI